MDARVPWSAVTVFVLVSFGLAWLVALPLWLNGGLSNPWAQPLLMLMMFTPAIGVLAALAVQRPRPKPVREWLGIWPLRPVGRTIGLAVLGLVSMVVLAVGALAIAAAAGVVQLDLIGLSGYQELIDAQIAASGTEATLPPIWMLVVAQFAAIPIGALVNSFFAFGEELGWRGWLLPALLPLGTSPALLLSGAIWGLWHAPVILLGYNFNEPNALGLLYMVIACTLLGVLLGWLRLRSGSLWPAVIAHGALNASASVALLFFAAGSTPSPVNYLPLGWPGWVVAALMIVLLMLSGQFNKRGALQAAPRKLAA